MVFKGIPKLQARHGKHVYSGDLKFKHVLDLGPSKVFGFHNGPDFKPFYDTSTFWSGFQTIEVLFSDHGSKS